MSRRHTRDDIDRFHDYDVHIPSRTISMFSVHTDQDGGESGVESALAERAIKNLTILEAISQEPITILLNTPGGDYYHGMAIYDAIKACKSHVTIKGLAQVMSMGSIIMQAADTRMLYPNAKMMIHYGYNSFDADAKTYQNWSKEFSKLDERTEQILLDSIQEKNPTFKRAQLKKMLSHDTILNAKKALSLGLIDEIVGEKKEEEDE